MNKTEAVKKGVETLQASENNVPKKENNVPKKEKTITAAELRTLIENLTIQFNEHNRASTESQTRAIETRGAITMANAQLQGLGNDTESTDRNS